jgi:hypothetical protein
MIPLGAKFDCLKNASVLKLEELVYTPFHLIATLLFALAIIHTLSVNLLHAWARKIEARRSPQAERSFWLQTLYFLSEVEVVFGVWVIPLFIALGLLYDWKTALHYINTRDYTEPLFVVVVLSLASTKPIVQFAETLLRAISQFFGGTVTAWWFTLLTLGPLLGSLITETGAMAVTALLLARQFYSHHPSPRLAYATLGLLFSNISIGGILTNFASPAVLVLSHSWNWTTPYMFFTYGWKAVLGVVFANLLTWFLFRKELARLNQLPLPSVSEQTPIPFWITLSHILFIFWIVLTANYPAIFVASFLFFLGFYQATRTHQYALRLARPLLVGFFLAGLVIHGGLQGWWVVRFLEKLSPLQVLGAAMGLTAFNDNTAIAYLTTLVPGWGEAFQYALFTGIIAGGGLTVIANAPNPAGYVILSKHFPNGISAWKLLQAALLPALIYYLIFCSFGPLLGLILPLG